MVRAQGPTLIKKSCMSYRDVLKRELTVLLVASCYENQRYDLLSFVINLKYIHLITFQIVAYRPLPTCKLWSPELRWGYQAGRCCSLLFLVTCSLSAMIALVWKHAAEIQVSRVRTTLDIWQGEKSEKRIFETLNLCPGLKRGAVGYWSRGPCHTIPGAMRCVPGKTLLTHGASLHPGVWIVTGQSNAGRGCDRLASQPGRSRNTPSHFMLRKPG